MLGERNSLCRFDRAPAYYSHHRLNKSDPLTQGDVGLWIDELAGRGGEIRVGLELLRHRLDRETGALEHRQDIGLARAMNGTEDDLCRSGLVDG